MKICPKCGKENSNNGNYCLYCGEKLSGTKDSDKRFGQKEKSKMLILGGLALLLVVVGVALFAKEMFIKGQTENSVSAATTVSEPEAEVVAETQSESVMDVEAETETETKIETKSETEAEQDLIIESTDNTAVSEVDTITSQTSVGDLVYYGTYEQNNIEDGDEQIEWLVLDEEDGRYLLITTEIIDCICYNNVWRDIYWKDCSLRNWLNTSFLTEAFTEKQINNITNSKHRDENGNFTIDKVFIMNTTELENYFDSDELRAAGATLYAEAKGVYVYDNGNCWWWVSDAGSDSHYAKYVNCEGVILDNGMLVFNNVFGVRPAIWVQK